MLSLALGCGGDGDEARTPERIFPLDYAESFSEVRGCRKSIDHDLHSVRVLVNDVALSAYQNRDAPFPEGSIIVKEEYVDDQCATDLDRWTAMKREAPGYAAQAGDWHWQRVRLDASVELDGKLASCSGCHASCQGGVDGHDWTCAAP